MGPLSFLFRRMRILSTYNLVVVLSCIAMTSYAVYYFRDKPNKTDHVMERLQHHRHLIGTGNISNSNINSNIISNSKLDSTVGGNFKKSNKIIFLHSFPSYYEIKMGDTHFQNCPVSNCVYEDKQKLGHSDAALFFTHKRTLNEPPEKKQGQIWVFFSVESPVHSGNSAFGGTAWQNKFNWTMTYRLDSDIKFGYGDAVHGRSGSDKEYFTIAKNKKKLIAWFVSNCNTQSERMKYVNVLKKYVPVDIYGNCGSLRCSRDNGKTCRTMLERDYKFYLSFENSICDDYVTEKLFNILKYDIVPIARGGANYSAVLPTKMAVNTADFANAKELGKYLKYLDNNIGEYVSYLKWKDSFHIVEPQPFPHCTLCERVNNPDRWKNSYSNVVDWWMKGTCRKPTDI